MGKFRLGKHFLYNRLAVENCYFRKLNFSNFKLGLAKILMKKPLFLWEILNVLIKRCYLTKFYPVEIDAYRYFFLKIFFVFYTEVHFLCLILSLRRFTAREILKWVIVSFLLFGKFFVLLFVSIFHIEIFLFSSSILQSKPWNSLIFMWKTF